MKKLSSVLLLFLVCITIVMTMAETSHHTKQAHPQTNKTVHSRIGTYYCNEGVDNEGYKNAWYIILKANGKFIVGPPSAVEGNSKGAYTIKADTILFKFPKFRSGGRTMSGYVETGRFKGNSLITELDTENEGMSAHSHTYVKARKKKTS